jgi:hypothetical protein
MTDFDTSELTELSNDLGKIPGRMVKDQVAAVEKSARRVESSWRQRWSGISHAPNLAKAVTHEVKTRPGEVTGIIGPDKDLRQGALGNIIEYGTSNNAPIPGGGPALKSEEPRLLKDIGDIAEDIL